MSARMSTKTGVAPRSANAVAVDENVNDGMITSSPARSPASSAAISSAAVHDGVSSARIAPVRSSSQSHSTCAEAAVARELQAVDRLADVLELGARRERPVERDREVEAVSRRDNALRLARSG